jgi:NTP pyrophosphatase (non-canonical NTP hydrolase)
METLSSLSDEAMKLRQRFADAAAARGRPGWTREQVMQGFVGDVGDLMKLVMAKSGVRDIADVDRKLEHELADCLWSVLVLARLYDVDLEQQFKSMIRAVSTQLDAEI